MQTHYILCRSLPDVFAYPLATLSVRLAPAPLKDMPLTPARRVNVPARPENQYRIFDGENTVHCAGVVVSRDVCVRRLGVRWPCIQVAEYGQRDGAQTKGREEEVEQKAQVESASWLPLWSIEKAA